MTERTVVVRLKAITADYEAALAKAGLGTKGLGSAISSMSSDIRNGELSLKKLGGTFDGLVSGQMAVAAAGVVAAGVLVKFGKDGVDAYVTLADHVREYQRVAGGSAEDASRMVEAFHAVGITSDEGATAIFRLSQNLQRNSQELAAAGVVVARDKQGNIDLNKTLLNLSDAYRNIQDPQQRNVLMMQALSRGALVLAPLLVRSRDEIQRFWNEAERHGLVMSQQDLDNAREYTLAVHELGDAWKGVEVQVGKAIVPELTQLIGQVEAAVTDAEQAIGRIESAVKNARNSGGSPVVRGLEPSLPGLSLGLNGPFDTNEAKKGFLEAIPLVGGLLAGLGDSHKHAADAASLLARAETQAQLTIAAVSAVSGVAQPRVEELAKAMHIDLATASATVVKQLEDAAVKLNAAISPTERLAAVTGTLADAYATGAEKVQAYSSAVDATLGSQLNAESAVLKVRSSLQGLANDLVTGQEKTESFGEYQGRLAGDLVSVVEAIGAQRQALVANGELAANDTASQQEFMVESLRNVEAEYPQLRAQIDLYIEKLRQIPTSVNTTVGISSWGGSHQVTGDMAHDAFGNPIGRVSDLLANASSGTPPIGHDTTATKNAESTVDSYLKALHGERLTEVDNMFKQGAMSVQEYVKALNGELAQEKQYTAEWESLQEKKQAALQDLADFYKGVVDHERELQDNEYAVGVLGKDQYLQLLEDRLAGLEKYSNAWKQVWDEIQRIEGDALGAEIKVIQAYDQGRQFQQAFDAAASSRAFSPQLSPVNVGAGAVTGSPTGSSVSYNPVFHVSSIDPVTAATLANQKMRDAAALLGL